MVTSEPDPYNANAEPPEDSRLLPVASFRAFHGNYTGIPRTGEMKLTIIIPIADIPAAMELAATRDELLWVQVSRVRFDEADIDELGKQIIAEGNRSAGDRSEFDWET